MSHKFDHSVTDLLDAIKVIDQKRRMAQPRIASIKASLRRLDELAQDVDGRP